MSHYPSNSRNCLFAYGTLMCVDIMARVCACQSGPTEAGLQGYSRHRVKGANYPGIVRNPQAQVRGVLYTGIPEQAWPRLDRFEGPLYRRQAVGVSVAGEGLLLAQTYVIHPEAIDRLEPGGWDFDDFLENGKAAFMLEHGLED